MVEKPAKGNQGKRYSAQDKAEIAKFIEAYNAEHKRGGMKAASDKFGVSVVTLSNWGKKTRTAKKRKSQVKKAAPKKTARPKTVVKAVANDPDAVLARLQAIRSEIAKLEKEYDQLKKQL